MHFKKLSSIHLFHQTLLGLVWLVFWLGGFHCFYLVLLLLQWAAPAWEKFLLLGYPLLLGWGVFQIFVKRAKAKHNFNAFLENEFQLGFRWYNLLHKSGGEQQLARLEQTEQQRVLGKVRLWEHFYNTRKKTLLAAALVLVSQLFLYAWPAVHSRFNQSLAALFENQTLAFQLDYPPRLSQGEAFVLRHRGDFSNVSLSFSSGERFTLSNGAQLRLEAVSNSFTFSYALQQQRQRKTGRRSVVVMPPPRLEKLALSIYSPLTKKRIRVSDVRQLSVAPASLITVELHYSQAGQLTQFLLTRNGAAAKRSASLTPYGARFEGRVSPSETEIHYSFQVKNTAGQLSRKDKLLIRKNENLPPKVQIISPAPRIAFTKPRPLPVSFTAEDDFLLATVRLQLEVRLLAEEGRERIIKTNVFLPAPVQQQLATTNFFNGQFVLPLPAFKLSTGATLRYRLRALDFAGLEGFSPYYFLDYLSAKRLFENITSNEATLQGELSERQEHFKQLAKEMEQLQLLSQKEALDEEALGNFAKQLEQLSSQIKQDAEALRQAEERRAASSQLRDKIAKLREKLESLDAQTLKKMLSKTQAIQQKAATAPVSQEELKAFAGQLDTEKLLRQVEQLNRSLEELQIKQELASLERLSANISERFKTLNNYLVFKTLTLAEAAYEGFALQQDLEYLIKKYRALQPRLPASFIGRAFVKKTQRAIAVELEKNLATRLGQLEQRGREPFFLSRLGVGLENLSRSFMRLNRALEQSVSAELVRVVEKQVAGFYEKSSWMKALRLGQWFVWESLTKERRRILLTKFLSEYKAFLNHSEAELALRSASFLLDLAFFDNYTAAREVVERLEGGLDPSRILGGTVELSLSQMRPLEMKTAQLAFALIDLREWIKRLEKQRKKQQVGQVAQQQQQLNERLSEAGRRVKDRQLTQQEKAYFKQLALEQAYLRQLLEEVPASSRSTRAEPGKEEGKGEGEGEKPGEAGGESGTKVGGKGRGAEEELQKKKQRQTEATAPAPALQEARAAMDQLAAELKAQQVNFKKVAELKEKIAGNLLRYAGEATGGAEEQTTKPVGLERQAEREFEKYSRLQQPPLPPTALYTKEQLKQLRNPPSFPAEHRRRLRAFLKALFD